jgi:hypothetical protein
MDPVNYVRHVEQQLDVPKCKAIVVDVDGTVALSTCSPEIADQQYINYRKWWISSDTPKAINDTKNLPVIENLLSVVDESITIIWLTGREQRSEEITKDWIKSNIPENLLDSSVLFMRPENDSRPDSVVKRDIIINRILPDFDIIYAIDDSIQNFMMWDSLKIPCFLVDVKDRAISEINPTGRHPEMSEDAFIIKDKIREILKKVGYDRNTLSSYSDISVDHIIDAATSLLIVNGAVNKETFENFFFGKNPFTMKILISVFLSEIAAMMFYKNKQHGNDILEPISVFSQLDSKEAVKSRIDAKLSKIKNSGLISENSDVILDLVGYLVLLWVLENHETVLNHV